MDPSTPIIVVNQTGSNWGLFWFVIFIFILLIVIAASMFWCFSSNKNSLSDISCDKGRGCPDGLICDQSMCRVPIGGVCSNGNQCVSGAACVNGICIGKLLGGVNESAPCQRNLINDNGICKIPLNGICNNSGQCASGTNCSNGRCTTGDSSCTSCSSESTTSTSGHTTSSKKTTSVSPKKTHHHESKSNIKSRDEIIDNLNSSSKVETLHTKTHVSSAAVPHPKASLSRSKGKIIENGVESIYQSITHGIPNS